MKLKVTLLTWILICSIPLVAQKKAYTKAEVEASLIIKLNNRIVDLKQKHKDATKQYDMILSTAESNIDQIKSSRGSYSIIAPIDYKIFEASVGNLDKYKNAYSDSHKFNKKKELNKLINIAKKNTQESVKSAKSISKYFSKKQFRSDANFRKYKTIKENFSSYFFKAGQGWNMAYKLIEEETNKAELISLQRSPIAEFIIPLKKDYNTLKGIINLLNEKDINTNKILDRLETLSKSINQNKDISNKNTSKLKDEQYKDVYVDFYENLQTTADAIKTYITEMDEDPESLNFDILFANINTSYNAVIASFNLFITQL